LSTTLTGTDTLILETAVRFTGSDGSFTDRYKTGASSLLPTLTKAFADGTGSGQAQKHYHDALSVGTGAGTTIDLTAVTSDNLSALSFSEVKRFVIRIRSAAAGVYLTVGNAASNVWAPWLSSSTATLRVDDVLYMRSSVDGWAVDSSNKNLKLVASAGTLTVDVSFIGH
jgi:hypothetical protein